MGIRSTSRRSFVSKLRQVYVLVSQGQPVTEAVRSIRVGQFTYSRWSNERSILRHWSEDNDECGLQAL